MDKTNIGNRMKMYEKNDESRIMPRIPIVARLDGRGFSKFTKGMKRPFDSEFREAMEEVTKYLLEQTHAKVGYTQSDEITLVYYADDQIKGSILFDGRVQKLCSTLSAMASVRFLLEMQKRFPDKVSEGKKLPTFDCRVFGVPNKAEAANAVLWRVLDATKNSISMVAHTYFSHKSLQGLNGKQMQHKLLTEKDINWNDYKQEEKQGSFFKRLKIERELTPDEISKIPPNKVPENKMVTRSVTTKITFDKPFNKVENRVGFIFYDETPKYY